MNEVKKQVQLALLVMQTFNGREKLSPSEGVLYEDALSIIKDELKQAELPSTIIQASRVPGIKK